MDCRLVENEVEEEGSGALAGVWGRKAMRDGKQSGHEQTYIFCENTTL